MDADANARMGEHVLVILCHTVNTAIVYVGDTRMGERRGGSITESNNGPVLCYQA